MEIIALLPAHNESKTIVEAIKGLKTQTVPPTQIIVIADNCTDDTETLALSEGAYLFSTKNNASKKAGALNQFLRILLRDVEEDDVVLVQDADSILDTDFIENALEKLKDPQYGAVGGVFRGDDREGFVPHLQRNEYSRYSRDVARLKGKCLVVTGTAAIFKAKTLYEISQARIKGILPSGDGRGGVYDTTVLTEDNELSFAIMHLGYKIISPSNCTLTTETMATWKDLWNQRLRWKRGAIENCFQYGLTKITWKYWGRQLFTLLGVIVTFLYLGTLVYALAANSFNLQLIWLAVTLIFVVERVVTVRFMGWKQMLISATMYELGLDLFLQLVHTKAYFDVITRSKRNW